MTDRTACHLCGAEAGVVAADGGTSGLDDLGGVTSDCRPWPDRMPLAVCGTCGTVQKAVTEGWRARCRDIYASYRVYRQGEGGEQAVFGAGSGMGVARSLLLLTKVLETLSPPDEGRLLDLGCGDGTLLRHAARLRPGWRLTGTDLGDHYRPAIEAIAGVERFHTGDLADLPGRYGLATALHVLEHVEGPEGFLRSVGKRLDPQGRLIVEVPDVEANPFDLLVVDHATHFSAATLSRSLRQAGFAVALCRRDWIPREISAIAVPAGRGDGLEDAPPADPARARRLVEGHVRWLRRLRDETRARAEDGGVGLFGTSIAASWLAGRLGTEHVRFFVDEDPARAGTSYLGRPVLAPGDVPAGATVCMPMTPAMAAGIIGRSKGERFALIPPPDLPPPGLPPLGLPGSD
ncbi:class I SAM-dependent methyltransferase [Azospirillum isscasi]|uniref:Class I SAM-dependent methyltransferase n=1 Tax=Azospirillum isscasi TaxID=3053926 RepID=A0ABU0WMJ1_9PROT|nr:class I SAM-dependent methyltransferase [Azospirillum isscasi]MDQ2105451.1 class I SAM-dependent methyltransferase [Azospirillum isscasi]